MITKIKYSLILVLLLSISTNSSSYEKEETKNILFIFSGHPGLIAYQMILNSFKVVLKAEYSKPYKIFVEYAELERFPDSNYNKYIFERLDEKYRDANLDLLILSGSSLIPLMKTYTSEELKNLPTISMSMYNPFNKNIDYSIQPNTIEILGHIEASKNFDLAFKLFPEFSNVYIISGSADLDIFFNTVVMSAASKYQESKNIINLFNLSTEELLDQVSQIPEESIIFVTTFTADANNVSYGTPEAIRLIYNKTKAPIFVFLDTSFEDGAFGGYVTSMSAAGREAGIAALKTFEGQNPSSIKVDPDNLNQFTFDWRELNRRGLEDSDFIPANSIILHRESSFIEDHKWLLSGIILFIILQTLLIANLVRLNRKQKLTTKKLIETENRFRELAREDRIMRMGELTASLSHELNQPLTAIRNSAQAGLRFLKSGKSNPEMMDEIFNNIVDDDKRAADVLSSIRQLMRFEKREKQKINLNPTIKQVADIFNGELKKKEITLQLNLSESPIYVLGDSTQLQQVLLNFISNAANAIEGVNNDKKIIRIDEIINGKNVTVSVRDYGIGISDSLKNNLFKPFFTTREKGFGIGLAISKSIIDEHEGKIWAENNSDGGATFSFQLNLYNDEQK